MSNTSNDSNPVDVNSLSVDELVERYNALVASGAIKVTNKTSTGTTAKIKELKSKGYTVSQIHKMGLRTKEGKELRYQHVRNVWINA